MKKAKNKLCHLTLLLLFIGSTVWASEIPRVENLKITAQEGEVTLRYDLNNPNYNGAVILFSISLDRGRSWRDPKGASGDLGRGIDGGSGKKIIWDLLKEFPNGIDKHVDFRVETRAERDYKPVEPDSYHVDAIKALLEHFIQVQNDADLNGLRDIYGNHVRYFSSGMVALDFIIKDKKAYFKRWPSVRISLAAPVEISATGGGNEWHVHTEMNFNVYSSRRRRGVKGISVFDLIVRKIGDRFRIVSQKEKVKTRKKYR